MNVDLEYLSIHHSWAQVIILLTKRLKWNLLIFLSLTVPIIGLISLPFLVLAVGVFILLVAALLMIIAVVLGAFVGLVGALVSVVLTVVFSVAYMNIGLVLLSSVLEVSISYWARLWL